MARPVAFPLSAGEKRLSASKNRPFNAENVLYNSHLDSIWPRLPATEIPRAKTELAADRQRNLGPASLGDATYLFFMNFTFYSI
jgi:hypothetical protein